MRVTKEEIEVIGTRYKISNKGFSVTLSPREWEELCGIAVASRSNGGSSQVGSAPKPNQPIKRGSVLYDPAQIIDHFRPVTSVMSATYQKWFGAWVRARVANSGYRTDKRTLAGHVFPEIRDSAEEKERAAMNYTHMVRKWAEMGLGDYRGNNVFILPGEVWGVAVGESPKQTDPDVKQGMLV